MIVNPTLLITRPTVIAALWLSMRASLPCLVLAAGYEDTLPLADPVDNRRDLSL